MKKCFSLFFSMIMLLAVVGAFPLEAQIVKLYDGNIQADFPNLITMKNGDLMLVFSDGTHFNSNARLMYMIYSQTTGTWSSPQQAVTRRNSATYPQLAIDGDGDIHMAYMDGNSSANRDIFYAMWSHANKRWSNARLAYNAAGQNSAWPRIQVEDNMIYITWSHSYADASLEMDICMIVNTKGGSWPVDRALRKTISNSPAAVSIHNDFTVMNKKIHTLWMDNNHRIGSGNWKMYYSEADFNPATNDWRFPNPLHMHPNVADNEYYPGLTVDPSGTVHVAYSYKNGPYLYSRKRPGGAWSAPTAIIGNFTTQNVFPYFRYHDGLIHTCFRVSDDNGENLIYLRGLPDGTWSPPINVATRRTHMMYPWMAFDHKGDAHVVWSEGPDDNYRSIYYTKLQLPGTPPQAVINTDKTRGLLPLTVRFDGSNSTDSDGTIRSYMWDFGDGATATGPIVTHTYTRAGFYTAMLKVLDNDYRVGAAEVKIFASTGDPLAIINASGTRGVVPFRVVFDGSESTDEDGQVVSYNWDFGDGNTATGPIVTHTYMAGGQYTARLTVTDNDGRNGTATRDISIFKRPTAEFTATPTGGLVPLTVEFDASASKDDDGNIVSYQWDFGDGKSGEGRTVTHTYTSGGPFQARLTVIDNDGYTDVAATTIEAMDKPAAPTQVAVTTDFNKALLYREYINKVSWQNNPTNSGLFTVAQYRIYRKVSGESSGAFVKVGEVAATQMHFDDRKFSGAQDAAKYEYAVTAVDGQGRESAFSSSASPR